VNANDPDDCAVTARSGSGPLVCLSYKRGFESSLWFDMQSILIKRRHADGVLQNLVVRPEGDAAFRVITGKRRYLALQRLKKDGAIDGSYQVPVEIKS